MKTRSSSSLASLRVIRPFCPACRRSIRPVSPLAKRHASTTTSASSSASSAKSRLWLRLVVVTATAAAAGAYFRWQEEANRKQSTLNPSHFTKYTLIAKEPVSSTCSIFTLKPAGNTNPLNRLDNIDVYEEAWRTGIWSVMFKQPQLQIGRDYTPLPPILQTLNSNESESVDVLDDENGDCLRFLIRRDLHGEVSRYLHALEPGAVIEARGPKIEFEIPSNTKELVFIAGGTGIAPALQAAYTLLTQRGEGGPTVGDQESSSSQSPRIHILWASRRREDCAGGVSDSVEKATAAGRSWLSSLNVFSRSAAENSGNEQENPSASSHGHDENTSLIVRELETLKARYPGQIQVDYFVDEENTSIGKKSIMDIVRSSQPDADTQHSRLILVSGPEGFVSYMAGPKVWAQGMELQGPVRGLLKELDLRDWFIWKL